MAKNLVIVESPAKAKTIEGFLGNEYTVKASQGHVRDLMKNTLSINVDKNFEPEYEISDDKMNIVIELKKLSKAADTVWLASDEDREGESISWHLYEVLDLKKKKNTKRIVFHEITKTAIQNAIEHPRDINMGLVNAQQARRVLDRLVGYELSPLLWKKVKPSLSAGRVQSVAVRLVVEREDEIKSFKQTSAYRVTAQFNYLKDGQEYNLLAELPHRFDTEEETREFLESCINATYKVDSIEKKPSVRYPAPPFTTSTLQQEAARKLGFSVANTMRIAQQLYESGKITYMRTDSVNLSSLALSMAQKEIAENYGEEYVKTRQYHTKSKGAQEAHEAIRPTYLNQHTIKGTADEKKLYDLIWKRTIASQMADAQMERTNVNIGVSTNGKQFVATGETILFDGFLKVYRESYDDAPAEDTTVLPPIEIGTPLDMDKMEAQQRYTRAPFRYNEASLVKKMEELGIGRPSTYAPTISTIQRREYVTKGDIKGTVQEFQIITLKNNKISEKKGKETYGVEKGKLIPTDVGILVNKFLLQYFEDIIDYNFTANVEKEFDEIEEGKREWNAMIRDFYKGFHNQVVSTTENSGKFSGEKLLGIDPASGKNVYVKVGRFGPVAQIGDTESEEKPRFAGLKKDMSIDSVTLEEVLKLFDFPRSLGEYEGQEITVAVGRFGPYVKHDNKFYSIAKTDNPALIDYDRAVAIINEKREKDINNILRSYDEDPELHVLDGRYGPYISYKKSNYKIPKGTDPSSLTYKQCLAIIEDPKNTPKKKVVIKKK